MNVKIVRCNNVYGPNQYPEKLIPKFIHNLKNDQKCTLHGKNTPDIKRAFIHVDDVTNAVLIIHKKGTPGEIYNISSDYELSVLDVTKMIIKAVKKTENYEDWVTHVDDRPFNDNRYYISSDKLKNLGWRQEKDQEYLEKFISQTTS
jgi:dTDP-glucose 4,6-dehydratase/UDP-glucose 4,6-dehydratase